MNILYASNDAYARHLGVSLCSLYDRNQEWGEITVYVMSMGISRENRRHLEEIAGRYSRKLRFLEMDDLERRLGGGTDSTDGADTGDRADTAGGTDTGGYDLSIMLRLFLGEMLPPQVERVLYLDCDTVVVQPLRKLWEKSLDGKVVGAVMEPTIYDAVKEAVGLSRQEPYYNSGVLLVDVKRWRQEGVQAELLGYWRQKGGTLFASDQDVLNGVLKGRIRSLSPRYNFFTNYRYFSYKELVRHAPSYGVVPMEQFLRAKRRPAILHFMGDERPWIAGSLNHYRRAYEKYLAMTPWAGTPGEKGQRGYMLAYHLMDYVTAVCPAVRWEISRRFGMKAVETRKTEKKDQGKEGK